MGLEARHQCLLRETARSHGLGSSSIESVDPGFFAKKKDSRGRMRAQNSSGTFIIGSKGSIWTDTYSSSIRVYPDKFFQELKSSKVLPPKTLARVKGGPFKDFTDAIKAGKKIKYNAKKMRVTNDRDANKYLESQYDYKEEFLPA